MLLMRIVWSFVWRKFSSVGEGEWGDEMKNGQKLKLGDAHVTPINIQVVQASKLGDAQGTPFFINKNIRSSFKTLYFYCFVCCNKWLDPIILVWKRDTLRFFKWILVFFTYICWVFLSSYCNAFSSCFSCISSSELVCFLQLYMNSSLLFIDFYLWELFQISWLVLEKSKILHAYSGAKGSLFRPWLRL
jgi:hypothetical protein